MRIAYLSQSYPPMVSGAAIYTDLLAKEMANRGHQVLVVAASDSGNYFFDIKENLSILRLRSYINPMRVGQRFMLFQQKPVEKALREFQPDLIHTQDPFQIGLTGQRYARKNHIPCIITLHQLPWFAASYLPAFLRPVVESVLWNYGRWLVKRFTTIIVPTQTIAIHLNHMTGFNANVIGYGVDLQEYKKPHSIEIENNLRKKFNIPRNTPIILHVGRLDTDKQVDRVILAAAQTIRETDAILLVVGDGRQKNKLTQLCERMGISDRVRLPGFIRPGQCLSDIYRMASLFITASEVETQGIVLLEAAASGLPLVAVNSTCIPEVVHDGINGFLADPGDIGTLSSSMIRLLKDPSLAKAMGEECKILAEKYDLHFTFDSHDKLYAKLNRAMLKPEITIVQRKQKRINYKIESKSG